MTTPGSVRAFSPAQAPQGAPAARVQPSSAAKAARLSSGDASPSPCRRIGPFDLDVRVAFRRERRALGRPHLRRGLDEILLDILDRHDAGPHLRTTLKREAGQPCTDQTGGARIPVRRLSASDREPSPRSPIGPATSIPHPFGKRSRREPSAPSRTGRVQSCVRLRLVRRTNSRALPRLGLILAGAGGFEPPHGGIKIRCRTAWLRPSVRPCRMNADHSLTSIRPQAMLPGLSGDSMKAMMGVTRRSSGSPWPPRKSDMAQTDKRASRPPARSITITRPIGMWGRHRFCRDDGRHGIALGESGRSHARFDTRPSSHRRHAVPASRYIRQRHLRRAKIIHRSGSAPPSSRRS